MGVYTAVQVRFDAFGGALIHLNNVSSCFAFGIKKQMYHVCPEGAIVACSTKAQCDFLLHNSAKDIVGVVCI